MEKREIILAGFYLLVVLGLSGTQIALMAKLNDNATHKYLRVIAPCLYIVGILGFLLGLYAIHQDQTYVVHILYGVIMLVCLPAALFSMSVSTIIGGNI
jgi:hypothetical protein